MKTIYATVNHKASAKVIECSNCYEVRYFKTIGIYRSRVLVDYTLFSDIEDAKDSCYAWCFFE